MRVLLTGISGQVGGALLPQLQGRVDLVTPPRSEFDLSRPETLDDALDRFRPDLIVNPAAYTAVDRAEDEPELAFRVNAESPSVLAQWAAKRRALFVHFSTDYVFDGSGLSPWRENDPCKPLSTYGKSKLAAEKAIAEAGGAHLIVRTSWVYAVRGRNFFRTIIGLARERAELRVVSDQVGSPTSARSIADAVGNILAKGDLSDLGIRFAEAGGLVHLANSEFTSWCGFADQIIEGLRRRGVYLAADKVVRISTKEFPTRACRPMNSRLDLTRLNEVFGLKMPSWQEALETELDAFVKDGAATTLPSKIVVKV
jgi:dTDP-4-dehydrorhamnose reductase